jgi:methionyl aminopeptidase
MQMRGTALSGKELESYRKAGKIASNARKNIVHLVRPGESILKICEESEEMIRKCGAVPAFPTNVSVNHITAHYTSPPNDETVFPDSGLVKIDLGASVDGYLSDTAVTVDLDGKESALIDASQKALSAAISIIKSGTSITSIGETISRIIVGSGLKPISNLTGHSLTQNSLHSGIAVPNVVVPSRHTMREGEVYAIEPFVTKKDGKGFVKDTSQVYIYSCSGESPKLGDGTVQKKELFNNLRRRFKSLPFALRWVGGDVDRGQFKRLLKEGLLTQYPVLVEASKKIVAQSEHTVLVRKYNCEVLTE